MPRYELSIIQYPNGKFGFVGSVPVEFAYVHKEGYEITPSEARELATSSNPAMTAKRCGITTRAFNTRQEAQFFAARRGMRAY